MVSILFELFEFFPAFGSRACTSLCTIAVPGCTAAVVASSGPYNSGQYTDTLEYVLVPMIQLYLRRYRYRIPDHSVRADRIQTRIANREHQPSSERRPRDRDDLSITIRYIYIYIFFKYYNRYYHTAV